VLSGIIRRASLAVVLAIVVLVGLPFGGAAHTCTPDPVVRVTGRLLTPRASGLALTDLPERAIRGVSVLPELGVVTGVARSPDGSRLAVARFWRPPDHQVGGQDILIVGPEGGEPLSRLERARAGEALGSPSWLPDGSLVFERRSTVGSAASARVEHQGLDGSASRVVAERAASPSASPDGARVAFIRTDEIDRLLIQDLAGGPERILVDDPLFLALAFPRFSPDGSRIAFAAVSDPSVAGEAPALGAPHLTAGARTESRDNVGRGTSPPLRLAAGIVSRSGGTSPPPTNPLSVLRTSVARAHGLPWDIWLVRPDGSELRRLTYFYDDDPSAAWSPDGRWLAVFSGEALHVVAVEGSENYCIAGEGGYGGLEWLP
jgi:Tol biopolymer transport system component